MLGGCEVDGWERGGSTHERGIVDHQRAPPEKEDEKAWRIAYGSWTADMTCKLNSSGFADWVYECAVTLT